MTQLYNHLTKPVNNAFLIVFRIIFGLMLLSEGFGAILTGWVKRTLVAPELTFTFIGFEWLSLFQGPFMYGVFIVLGLCGIAVMLGFYYRFSLGLFTILWTGCYLMQKSAYNNHYYLLILLCVFMLCVPAHRYYPLDVKRNPSLKRTTCPHWCRLIFILQLTIVYTYAAIAKMQIDWIEARPISIWFDNKSDLPVFGPLLAQEWFQYAVAWGGLAFDLLICPLLLWSKTRNVAFAIYTAFHLFNSAVFQIGIFPYLMIGAGVFFFTPDQVGRLFFKNRTIQLPSGNFSISRKWMVAGAIYFIVQMALPLRHHLFASDVTWTEEGHRLSWRMMLRTKQSYPKVWIEDKSTGERTRVKLHKYLNDDQEHTMAGKPDMMWQFAQMLEEKYENKGKDVGVYIRSVVYLNGKSRKFLVRPETDLANVPWYRFRHAKWVEPFDQEIDGKNTQ